MGRAVIPPGLLFGLGLLSADRWGQIFPKWPPPEKGMLMNIPKSFASNVLPPQQATFTPAFPKCPPRTTARCDPDSHRYPALPWDPVHMKVCVRLLRMGPLFPQSHGAPAHKPHWPSRPDVPGALSPSARSPHVRVCAQNSVFKIMQMEKYQK